MYMHVIYTSFSMQVSHSHQIESSYGESLTLDGFILMFNLLINITDSRVCRYYHDQLMNNFFPYNIYFAAVLNLHRVCSGMPSTGNDIG